LQSSITYEGTLFYHENFKWRRVCSENFTEASAKTACRQLGLAGGSVGTAEEVAGEYWIDSVTCPTGEENTLSECYTLAELS